MKFNMVKSLSFVNITIDNSYFGIVIDVPNLWVGATSGGDFFVPLSPNFKQQLVPKVDDIAAKLSNSSFLGSPLYALVKSSYEQGPAEQLAGKTLTPPFVKVLSAWSKPS
ncbi:MAG: hypothetical protein JRH20_30145 [Deltaproteobacteria bacterium]|nr:hypothetical protein [Deltaproteobacteria bacterium]